MIDLTILEYDDICCGSDRGSEHVVVVVVGNSGGVCC